jgi:Amt family ammonium transporter
LVIGVAAGIGCFLAVTKLTRLFGYDDSLDVFGVHAVGGIIGALLTGVFCAEQFGGAGFGADGITGIGGQLVAQSIGIGATVVYTAIVSFILLKIIDAVMGLRVSEDQETEGLDLALHDEKGYSL